MNSSWEEKVILNFFASRVDLFGEKSTYLEFETNKPSKTSIPDGFNSVQLYGTIVFKDDKGNVRKSTPLMIKVMQDVPPENLVSFGFTNEINFYSKTVSMLGTLDSSIYSLFPKFYHGELKSDSVRTRSAIIFEDLKASGYKLAEKWSFLDFEHLALMMRKLGRFHAFSYKAKTTSSWRWFNCMVKNFHKIDPFLTGMEAGSCEILLSVAQRGINAIQKDSTYVPYIKALLENIDSIHKQGIPYNGKDNPTSVMVHGDYLRSNVMFRYDENNTPDDLLMVDMATCSYDSPAIDLAKVLYMNADQTTRNKYWDRLIDEYYAALKDTFPENQVPSKDTIMGEFIGKCAHIYLMAAFFTPGTIGIDNNCFHPEDVLPGFGEQIQQFKIEEIPEDVRIKFLAALGGEQGTQALTDILKDMIDRGFICK